MAVWNVVVPVIANLEAETGDQAAERLAGALRRAGFDTYGYGNFTGLASLDPFEAEPDTEPDTLPES